MNVASPEFDSGGLPQPTNIMTSNEPIAHTRRNITLKGTSATTRRRSASVRRSLLAVILALGVAACATASDDASVNPDATATSVTESISIATTTVAPAPTVATTTIESIAAVTTTTLPVSSTVRTQPRLSLSQSTGLDPAGTLITVRGSGFDESKGVYVFVCNQAAWNATRRCIGGVNLDGSSPLSQWISSNPPGYAEGLTVPYESGGSFVVPLLVRATDSATNLIDCAREQCGVVAFADHTRITDRSQDVFVPITFTSAS